MQQSEKCYLESLDILRLMFGETHEYVVSVDEKLTALKAQPTTDVAMVNGSESA